MEKKELKYLVRDLHVNSDFWKIQVGIQFFFLFKLNSLSKAKPLWNIYFMLFDFYSY